MEDKIGLDKTEIQRDTWGLKMCQFLLFRPPRFFHAFPT